MRKTIVLGALLGLVLAQAAGAHVEPKPAKIKAGAVAKVTFEVPAEEKVPAIEFAVQMPAGLTQVRPHPASGWKEGMYGRVAKWLAGRIPPGKTAHFSLTARWPDRPGATLVFPSIEIYKGGKTVHWIGPESAEFPAARVTLTGSTKPTTTTTVAMNPLKKSDNGGNGWIWILLAAAILASLSAILLVRRRRA